MKKAIGGFFELELAPEEEYHDCKMKFNFARHAISFFFKNKGINQVYIPSYICNSVIDSLHNAAVNIKFYHIDDIINPTMPEIKEDQGLLIVNYFGLTEINTISHGLKQNDHVLLDNSQAFFSKPKEFQNVVYSARKFFGVPDGAYLDTDLFFDNFSQLPRFKSLSFTKHLIQRIENGPEAAYSGYKKAQKLTKKTDPGKISKFSQRVLKSIDYQNAIEIRKHNFKFFRNKLESNNKLSITKFNAPLCYAFLSEEGKQIRKRLINNRIYVPQYWPQVLSNTISNNYDKFITENLVCLPIDQRYDTSDLENAIKILDQF